jgi:3-deoxy-D-manno-octulosonate 8-phosphate phosphatase (KDO 8-P phosphatase)
MTAGPDGAPAIRALILDVDGVLTDGGVILDEAGREWKRFHTRDGVGIKLAQQAGIRVLFLTARGSQPARRRAEELKAEWAIGVARKESFLEAWLAEAGIDWTETAYVGDDLHDLGAMSRVGRPIAVADAAREIREVACHVTSLPGGSGAVREAVEWLLEEAGIREATVKAFVKRTEGFGVGAMDHGGQPGS